MLRSRDGGATFTAVNSGLTSLRMSRGNRACVGERGGANLTVFGLAIDPSNPDVLYAGGGSGVFTTVTAGEPR